MNLDLCTDSHYKMTRVSYTGFAGGQLYRACFVSGGIERLAWGSPKWGMPKGASIFFKYPRISLDSCVVPHNQMTICHILTIGNRLNATNSICKKFLSPTPLITTIFINVPFLRGSGNITVWKKIKTLITRYRKIC